MCSAARRPCSNTAAAGWVVSGDYKRRRDPTCAGFEPQPCDVFITEATFGLPVFRHPPDTHEIGRLLHSVRLFPERCHLVGVYALGKCQRLIALLREAGYGRADLYAWRADRAVRTLRKPRRSARILLPVAGVAKDDLAGRIVLAPPSALADRWSRRLPDPVLAMASGWMRGQAAGKGARR